MQEGLTEENRVISLNEHADSLKKVTTVKLVARVFRDLMAQLSTNGIGSLLTISLLDEQRHDGCELFA